MKKDNGFQIPALSGGTEDGLGVHDRYVGQAIAGLCAALSPGQIADLSAVNSSSVSLDLVYAARNIATTALSLRSREILRIRGNS